MFKHSPLHLRFEFVLNVLSFSRSRKTLGGCQAADGQLVSTLREQAVFEAILDTGRLLFQLLI